MRKTKRTATAEALTNLFLDLFRVTSLLLTAGDRLVARHRLGSLSKSLGDKPYLDGDRFTAGDLMMSTVLRILHHTDIVTSDRRLAAYVERCTARPAFRRALDAQLGDFRQAA